MDRLVSEVFCAQDSAYGSYKVPGTATRATGVELLSDTVYRYRLVDRGTKQAVTVQFYLGVSEAGEGLWNQEWRVLQRVASLRHPALPEFVDGGYIDEAVTAPFGVQGCAFVITRSGGLDQLFEESDPEEGMRAGLNETIINDLSVNRADTVGQFMALADALSVLHDMGIVHRNIWPGTIGQVRTEDGIQLVLTRFEMSSLVSNLLRSTLLDAGERARQARLLTVAQGADALAYFSPERITFLLVEGARLEDHRSDIYGLGMMVAEWMTGPIPPELIAGVAEAMTSGPDRGPDQERLLVASRAVNSHLRKAVQVLPGPLAALLRDMTEWDSVTTRPSAIDVVGRLSDHYEQLTAETEYNGTPYLMVFMPEECRDTLLKWEQIDNDPASEEGLVETAEFILSDLRGARVLHIPGGAVSFLAGQDPDKLRAAEHVLLGTENAWFCRPWSPERGRGRMGKPDPRALLAAFVINLNTSRGRSLRVAVKKARKQRLAPVIDVVASTIDVDEMAAELDGRPSWLPLFAAVRDAAPLTKNERTYTQAFDWLLQFQRTELESRQYPYVAEGAGERDRVLLRFDEQRDKRWRHSSAFATQFANETNLRPPMGDFFAGASNEDGTVTVSLRADDRGVPARTPSFVGDCVQAKSEMVEVVAGKRSARIPERGWISLSDDFGSWVALNRQDQAKWELLGNRLLVDQLARPNAMNPPALTKRSTNAEVADALGRTEPLFALQGPPGTGKTETTSDAVVSYLNREPGARVLVSTQSNFALDNIAERLLGKLGLLNGSGSTARGAQDVIAVRATGIRGEDKVDSAIAPFLINNLAELRQGDILKRTRELLAEAEAENDIGTPLLLSGWEAAIRDGLPELIDRVQRAANLVFATCSSATPSALERSAATDIFDLVVIEEAAKAWPTELAIPLSRGTRWALVGDHRQLPAHRRREIVQFLDRCAASTDDDLLVHGNRKDDYVKVFDLFGNLFVDGPKPVARPPRHTLRTQYRMRPDICEIVSRAFYPVEQAGSDGHVDLDAEGMLATGRDDVPVLRHPRVAARRSVVWLDTSAVPSCAEQPAWQNPGEVQVVRSFLRSLSPEPARGRHGYGDHPIAVLTPYRRQVEQFNSWAETRPHVSTIHAFQGREANVVVVSLVRDRARPDSADRPWANIGHLHEPELVNVLFSRAREHLVIVGAFQHFHDHGGPMWSDVCALVERFGTVVPADDPEAI
ncbi:AAA domain-containing protein [Actinokineospora bangkokensis]|nr:AAA domain-containing protein [Actinokineospora bangkokensis]